MSMKPTYIVVGATMGMCLFLASLGIYQPVCRAGGETSMKFPIQLEDAWVPAYESDFSEKELKSEWVVTAGNAIVEEGALVLRAAKGYAQIILYKPCFPSPGVRMEFGVSIADYAKLNDMSPFLNANQAGCAGSYLFQLGAEQNTVDRLRRIGIPVQETVNDTILLEHRHLYHVVAENDRGHLRFVVDGTTIFEWDDPIPLWGPEHCHIGFYTWESEIHIDYLRIYQKVPKH